MISEKEYLLLKEQIEQRERQASEAKGALTQLMSQLKKEFKCCTIKEAKILLKKLEKEKAENEERFNSEFKQFKREYRETLKSLENEGHILPNKISGFDRTTKAGKSKRKTPKS